MPTDKRYLAEMDDADVRALLQEIYSNMSFEYVNNAANETVADAVSDATPDMDSEDAEFLQGLMIEAAIGEQRFREDWIEQVRRHAATSGTEEIVMEEE